MGALAAMPFLPEILPWTALSFLAGAGTAAVATVATLFVVEFNPQDEWEPRIGWLQTFNGGGQVAGLLLAGIFGSDFRVGLFCSAAALLPALWLGARGLPVAAKRHTQMTEIGTRMRHDMDWRLLCIPAHDAGTVFQFPLGDVSRKSRKFRHAKSVQPHSERS